MADGRAALEQHIARVRGLPRLVEATAPAIAEALERDIEAQIARAETPEGVPWKPTATGDKALRKAARAIAVGAIGDVLVIRLSGVEARHHYGAVKGGVKRQVIPTAAIPAPTVKTIGRVLGEAFEQHMREGRPWR